MKKPFDAFLSIFKNPAAPSVAIADALDHLRVSRGDDQRKVGDLQNARAELLADEAGLARNRAETRVLQDRIEDADMRVGVLETRLAAALHAEEQARRQTAFDALKSRHDKAADAIDRYYAGAEIILLAQRDILDAQRGSDVPYPEKADVLSDPEQSWREVVPGQSKRVLKTKRVSLWVPVGDGKPLPPDLQKKVVTRGQDDSRKGFIDGGAQHGAEVVLCDFDRIEFLPDVAPQWRESIAATLSLPGLYSPPFASEFGPNPTATIAAIDAALAALPADIARRNSPTLEMRTPQVEFVKINAPAQTGKLADTSQYYHDGPSKRASAARVASGGR